MYLGATDAGLATGPGEQLWMPSHRETPFARHGLEVGIGKPPGEARYGLERHVGVLAAVPAGFERTRRWCARGCGRQNIDVGSSSAQSLSIGHLGGNLCCRDMWWQPIGLILGRW